jgi:hypothetical protein
MSFNPSQSLPSWNHDWTSDDRWFIAYHDPACINMFIDALNERLQAVGGTLLNKYVAGGTNPYCAGIIPITETTNTNAGTVDGIAYNPLSKIPVAVKMTRGTVYVGSTAVQTFISNRDGSLTFTPIGTPTVFAISGRIFEYSGVLAISFNVAPGANHCVVTYTQASYDLNVIFGLDSYAAHAGTVGAAWKTISSVAAGLFGLGFVPAYDTGGTPLDYTGAIPLTAGVNYDETEGDDGFLSMPLWAYKIQKKRFPRFIRTIYYTYCQQPNGVETIDYTGATVHYGGAAAGGQKALLTDTTSRNVGKLHTYSGGVWVLDTSGAKLPDTITVTCGTHNINTGTTYGVQEVPYSFYVPIGGAYPCPPDYFDAHYLNELRDLINQAVAVRYSDTGFASGSQVVGGPGLGGQVALYWVAGGRNWGSSGTHYGTSNSPSYAVADYNSHANRVYNQGDAPYATAVSDGGTIVNPPTVTYYIARAWGTPQIENLPMAGVCHYQVYFIAGFPGNTAAPSEPPTGWGLPQTSNPPTSTSSTYFDLIFDGNGDGLTYKCSHGFAASTIVNTETVTGTQLGTDAPPNVDTAVVSTNVRLYDSMGVAYDVANPAVPPSPVYGVQGYDEVALYAIVRYDVTNGFTYQKA